MGGNGPTNNWSKGYKCPLCGGPMSNDAKYSCRSCVHGNAEVLPLFAFSTDWFTDSIGIFTRLHGDV